MNVKYVSGNLNKVKTNNYERDNFKIQLGYVGPTTLV
jgi:hypothetical protein